MPELDIYDELRKLISLLDEHEINYALCGGLAMAIHARARSTIDIDMLILTESLEKVLSKHCRLETPMLKVDMSSAAVTTRLKRVSQLRRLCLSLAAAKVGGEARKAEVKDAPGTKLRSPERETK